MLKGMKGGGLLVLDNGTDMVTDGLSSRDSRYDQAPNFLPMSDADHFLAICMETHSITDQGTLCCQAHRASAVIQQLELEESSKDRILPTTNWKLGSWSDGELIILVNGLQIPNN